MAYRLERVLPRVRPGPLAALLVGLIASCGGVGGGGGGGGGGGPISNLTALQIAPGQSFYACSDSLGASIMPQTPLAFGGNPMSPGYAFSVPGGQSLPTGVQVQIDAGTGIMTGTIANNVAAGDYPLSITVSDGLTSNTGDATIHMVADGSGGTIGRGSPPPFGNGVYYAATGGSSVTSCPIKYTVGAPTSTYTLPSVVANEKYGANAFIAGFTQPNWTTSAPLPPGLQMNPANGTVYGTVAVGAVASNFSFRALAEPGQGARYLINVTQ